MPEPCSLREMESVEGFDADQKESLRSRKRAKGNAELTETEKWRDIYRILFPHVEPDDIPSPCKFNHCCAVVLCCISDSTQSTSMENS